MLSSDIQVNPGQHARCRRPVIPLIAVDQEELCWPLEDMLQSIYNLWVLKDSSHRATL